MKVKIPLGIQVKRSIIAAILLISLLLVTAMSLILFKVTLDLGFLKGGIEASAKSALGREVTIAGQLLVEFSTWPAIEAQDVRIANAPGSSSSDFFQAGLARLQIGLLPLIKGDIKLGDLIAENVSINLESNEQGQPNWVFSKENDEIKTKEESGDTPGKTSSRNDRDGTRFSVRNLSLKDVNITYHDASLDKTIHLELAAMDGEASPGKPVSINLAGQLQAKKYDLEFVGGATDELFVEDTPWQFKLHGDLLGKEIKSQGYIAIQNKQPKVNLEFALNNIDLGAALSELGLVEGLSASAGSMGIELTLTGNSLREIAMRSSIAFYVNEGKWRIKSPTSDAYFDVTSLDGRIFADKGKALTMNLEGLVNNSPVTFIITGAPLVDYIAVPETAPLSIDAEFADSNLRFAGELALPITKKDLSLSLAFNTTHLDNLNEVLKLDLPSIGPIGLVSRFQLHNKEYDLSQVDLQIGESKLEGKMNLDMSAEKPVLDVELISEQFRLDDVDTLFKKLKEGKQSVAKDDEETDEKINPEKKNLLSPEVLGSFDAGFLLEAKQVTSGADDLGSGLLKVSLEDGRLSIEPLQLTIPGGGVQVGIDYLPADDGVTFNLTADIEKFDLGILMRRIKSESDMGGSLTLDTDLHSQAPDAKSIMEYADGHFDFVLVPQNFSAGIIDLWAVNLLSAIMTKVTEEEKSEINCIVVRLGIEDGLMEEKAIYMDTSNMRIKGKAEIDFELENIDLRLVPKAKKPEFFSLAVPIKVKGTLDDFGLKIGLAGLSRSLVSFITSPIHVPIRRIFADEIPEDGQEACWQAWLITGDEK